MSLFNAYKRGAIGSIIEWYDFTLWSFFAPVVSKLFFHTGSYTENMLLAYVLFAVSYLARPVGAIIFGCMGDKLGRRFALLFSLAFMSCCSFLMGCLPTYDSIGFAAVILIVVLRVMQGISTGGETSGAYVYVLEFSPKHRQGFMGGAIWAMVILGIVIASGVSSLIHYYSSHWFLITWGWRIGFWLTGLLGFVVFLIRRKMEETADFKKIKQNQLGSLWVLFLENWRVFVIGFFIFSVAASYFYIVFVYMVGLFEHHFHIRSSVVLVQNTISLFICVLSLFVFGRLSDLFYKPLFAIITAVLLAIYSFFCFSILSNSMPPITTFLFVKIGFAILIAAHNCSLPSILVNLIKPEVRYTMVSVSYNFSFALFGGFAPLIATELLLKASNVFDISLFLMLTSAISVVALLCAYRRLKK